MIYQHLLTGYRLRVAPQSRLETTTTTENTNESSTSNKTSSATNQSGISISDWLSASEIFFTGFITNNNTNSNGNVTTPEDDNAILTGQVLPDLTSYSYNKESKIDKAIPDNVGILNTNPDTKNKTITNLENISEDLQFEIKNDKNDMEEYLNKKEELSEACKNEILSIIDEINILKSELLNKLTLFIEILKSNNDLSQEELEKLQNEMVAIEEKIKNKENEIRLVQKIEEYKYHIAIIEEAIANPEQGTPIGYGSDLQGKLAEYQNKLKVAQEELAILRNDN